MRRFVLFLAAAFAGVLALGGTPQKGKIKIDLDRTIGEIDPKIYGNFVEHLGRCIYGGVFDFGSPLSDADGVRKDVLEASRSLRVSILRWPGGNFVSGYHWTDGIGRPEDRPKRLELAWGAVESNRVGTDEFLRYCEKLGTEPYICVNMGTGSWDEARDWVEYCNRDSGTYYADLRRKNGRANPYGVTYWALGNEMDGGWQMGHRNAEDYGKYALEAAKLMKWVDQKIKLVASGSSDFSRGWTDWNRTVLEYLKEHIDYVALHTYVGNRENDYYRFMTSVLDVEERIRIVEGLIRETLSKARRTSPIYIAFDEYNVWYRAWTAQGLEETYNLEDALVIAQFLNTFIRNAHVVKIANMAQLVNVIAPIRAEKDGLWLQTIYYPLELFARECHGTSLDLKVSSGTFDAANRKAVPFLDVAGAYDARSGAVVLCVVNRHKDSPVETEIVNQSGKFGGEISLFEVNGPEVTSFNGPRSTPVKTVRKTLRAGGSSLTYAFPPHSFTLLKVKAEEPR
jgi:alpha-N-arabinofuranosidase